MNIPPITQFSRSPSIRTRSHDKRLTDLSTNSSASPPTVVLMSTEIEIPSENAILEINFFASLAGSGLGSRRIWMYMIGPTPSTTAKLLIGRMFDSVTATNTSNLMYMNGGFAAGTYTIELRISGSGNNITYDTDVGSANNDESIWLSTVVYD